jgi:hypothetical protein
LTLGSFFELDLPKKQIGHQPSQPRNFELEFGNPGCGHAERALQASWWQEHGAAHAGGPIDPAAARLALREMLGFALALKMRPTATPPGALP